MIIDPDHSKSRSDGGQPPPADEEEKERSSSAVVLRTRGGASRQELSEAALNGLLATIQLNLPTLTLLSESARAHARAPALAPQQFADDLRAWPPPQNQNAHAAGSMRSTATYLLRASDAISPDRSVSCRMVGAVRHCPRRHQP